MIRIRNQQKKVRIDLSRLRKIAQSVLRLERKGKLELNILISDNGQMSEYHRKYLGINGPTDVIAFGMQEGKRIVGRSRVLGDIAVSAEMAREMAKHLHIPFQEEIARYLVHGILHLFGYRDHNVQLAAQMHRKQEELLRTITRNQSTETRMQKLEKY